MRDVIEGMDVPLVVADGNAATESLSRTSIVRWPTASFVSSRWRPPK
jgi:hypothetical protein